MVVSASDDYLGCYLHFWTIISPSYADIAPQRLPCSKYKQYLAYEQKKMAVILLKVPEMCNLQFLPH